MFTKLLKQDFKSIWRVLGILCLTAVGLSLMAGLSIKYVEAVGNSDQVNFPIVACIIICVFSFIYLIACGVGSLLVCLGRFYKSRFTDEGYLTFTLPVTTHQILLSSLLSSVVSMLAVGIVIALSVLLMVLVGVSGIEEAREGLAIFFREELPQLWQMLLNYTDWMTRTEIVVNGVLSYTGEMVVTMLALTIGALAARKHKIFMAIVFYYVFHIVMSIVYTFGMLSLEPSVSLTPKSVLGLYIVGMLVVNVGGYFLMHYLADRKLNLP